jgi:mitochondrial cardiolipin hydrolase
LKEVLQSTFDDQVLSKGERQVISKVFKEIVAPMDRRFIRNRAFEIVQDYGPNTQTLKWLEEVIKCLDDKEDEVPSHEVYFSPGEACRQKIIALCGQAKKSIKVCVFTISDNPISQAILKAHQRGVDVRVISDDDKSFDKGSDVDRLSREGVPVRLDKSPDHMHHKFAIFDGSELLNGSFNWTRSASEVNRENILVTNTRALIKPYVKEFDRLWSDLA